MPTDRHIQYQIKTQPVFATPEAVTESRWHQPWSEPVRFRINRQHAIALAAAGPFMLQAPTNEDIRPDKWLRWWSEPVRFRGYAAQSRPWLLDAAQPVFTTSPVPFVSFGWFAWLNGPARPPIPGLAARLQQTLAQPPRLLPTPTITGTLAATETNPDTALFGGVQFAAPTAVELGVVARLR